MLTPDWFTFRIHLGGATPPKLSRSSGTVAGQWFCRPQHNPQSNQGVEPQGFHPWEIVPKQEDLRCRKLPNVDPGKPRSLAHKAWKERVNLWGPQPKSRPTREKHIGQQVGFGQVNKGKTGQIDGPKSKWLQVAQVGQPALRAVALIPPQHQAPVAANGREGTVRSNDLLDLMQLILGHFSGWCMDASSLRVAPCFVVK